MYEGDEWSMEVDLRSEEKEKRTLHFFVREKQQTVFFKGVPDRVEFGVWSFYFLPIRIGYLFVLLMICIQVVTFNQTDKIEFVRLEELNEPSVHRMDGEVGVDFT